MKLSIISVSGKMPAWVADGYEEYARRLPKKLFPQLIELPLAIRTKTLHVEKIRQQEGARIMRSLPKGSRMIALDVLGKALTTHALAKKIEDWQMQGSHASLVIGGPDGLSQECKEKAEETWSLSALTLPHPLVRIVLIEQIYRAWAITQNHPYHK